MGLVPTRLRRRRRVSAPSVPAALVVALLAFTSCGGEEITDYQPEDRNEFLEACTLPGEDPILVTSFCVCVYDELTDDLAYEEFRALSDSLAVEEPPLELDETVVGAMGTCLAGQVTGEAGTFNRPVDNLD